MEHAPADDTLVLAYLLSESWQVSIQVQTNTATSVHIHTGSGVHTVYVPTSISLHTAHFVVAERLVKADPALEAEPKLD